MAKHFIYSQFTSNRIPVNIRPVVYCTAISESVDSKEWDHLWNAYKTTNVAAEQRVIYEALGCTRNAVILRVISPRRIVVISLYSSKFELFPFQKYLNIILTDDIRLQDKTLAFSATFRDAANIDVVLDFVIENHKKMSES